MKRFEKFTHRQIKSLINHLKKYGQHADSEVLHQIRVDIKKIKAILAAINHCVKRFKAHKNFIPFRNIFRRAGDIREPDVLARLLQQYPVEGIGYEEIPAHVKQLAADFNSDTPDFVGAVKGSRKKLKTFSRQVHRDDLTRYLKKKKKEVKYQLYPRPKMLTIHKVRKSIKEIVYLSEAGDKLKKKETKFYEKMQDIIGRLHDKQALLTLLKSNKAIANEGQGRLIKSECLSDKKEIVSLANDYYGGRRETTE